MSNKRLFSWCQSILPANYQQIKSKTAKLQRFFEAHLPDSISQRIQVINTTKSEIVIAVDDPQITNYLRLHQREIQQQLLETFNTRETLKFRTLPEGILKPGTRANFRPPTRVSSETADSIKRNAQWVEDSALKQALESLANSIGSKK